jgi:hypothetical protein
MERRANGAAMPLATRAIMRNEGCGAPQRRNISCSTWNRTRGPLLRLIATVITGLAGRKPRRRQAKRSLNGPAKSLRLTQALAALQ